MKLYATTTSERASKSQGGNKYSQSIVTIDKVTVAEIMVTADQDDENYLVKIWDKERGLHIFAIPKGEKQKTAKCGICGKPTNGISCCIPL